MKAIEDCNSFSISFICLTSFYYCILLLSFVFPFLCFISTPSLLFSCTNSDPTLFYPGWPIGRSWLGNSPRAWPAYRIQSHKSPKVGMKGECKHGYFILGPVPIVVVSCPGILCYPLFPSSCTSCILFFTLAFTNNSCQH